MFDELVMGGSHGPKLPGQPAVEGLAVDRPNPDRSASYAKRRVGLIGHELAFEGVDATSGALRLRAFAAEMVARLGLD